MTRARCRHGLTALLLAFSPLLPPALAEPNRPDAPPSRPEDYEPNREVCTEKAITAAFENHLRPWADQPEPVQQRLRLLQAEMTRTSLTRCVELGLMTAAQAGDLERRLGLAAPKAPPAPVQSRVRP